MYCVLAVNSADSKMSCPLASFVALIAVSIANPLSGLHLPHATEVHQQSIRSLNQQAHIDWPTVEHGWGTVVEEAAFGFDSNLDWLLGLHVLDVRASAHCLYLGWEEQRRTLPIILTDTRSFGKSLVLASNFCPNGGFLLMSNSIRCGSAASNASILLTLPITNLRIATEPTFGNCFI